MRRLGSGDGRVGVALDDDRARRIGLERVGEGGDHGADLAPPGHSADSGEPQPWLGQAHAAEVASGERVVVVLSGVDEATVVAEAADDPRQFDDLGPGAEHHSHRTTGFHGDSTSCVTGLLRRDRGWGGVRRKRRQSSVANPGTSIHPPRVFPLHRFVFSLHWAIRRAVHTV